MPLQSSVQALRRREVELQEEVIDRIAPRLRPRGVVVNRQRWAELLFLHWTIPVSQLRPLVPSELEIDTFDGNAYVGLIPFTIKGARAPFTPPLPGISSFDEVNVRTYVHFRGGDPGVFFFTLEASSLFAVRFARAFFHLPYRDARIRAVQLQPFGTGIDYTSQRRGDEGIGMHVIYRRDTASGEAEPGTLDHFLVERYILYAHDSGRLYQGRVHHKPYPLRSASVSLLDETLLRNCGLLRPAAPPIVHYSAGVDVEIFALKKIG